MLRMRTILLSVAFGMRRIAAPSDASCAERMWTEVGSAAESCTAATEILSCESLAILQICSSCTCVHGDIPPEPLPLAPPSPPTLGRINAADHKMEQIWANDRRQLEHSHRLIRRELEGNVPPPSSPPLSPQDPCGNRCDRTNCSMVRPHASTSPWHSP